MIKVQRCIVLFGALFWGLLFWRFDYRFNDEVTPGPLNGYMKFFRDSKPELHLQIQKFISFYNWVCVYNVLCIFLFGTPLQTCIGIINQINGIWHIVLGFKGYKWLDWLVTQQLQGTFVDLGDF